MSRTFRMGHVLSAEKEIAKESKLVEARDGLSLWATPRGNFWVPSTISSFFFILAEQETKVYGEGSFAVQPGDIVLDCGGNVGVFTSEALKAGASLVVTFEPVPKKIECLKRNFAAELAAGRMILIEKGVWNEKAVLEMSLYEDVVLDSFVNRNHSGALGVVPLPVTTIDETVHELKLPRVHFIKIDVEGAARNALEGAQETIAKYKPRIAIGTEDLPDDYIVTPAVIRKAWPKYQFAAAQCRLRGTLQILPEVLHCWPTAT